MTASIASVFVAHDAADDRHALTGAEQLEALRDEVATLTRRVEALLERQPSTDAAAPGDEPTR